MWGSRVESDQAASHVIRLRKAERHGQSASDQPLWITSSRTAWRQVTITFVVVGKMRKKRR